MYLSHQDTSRDHVELNVDKEVIYSPYGPKNEFFVVNNWAELTRVPAMKVLT